MIKDQFKKAMVLKSQDKYQESIDILLELYKKCKTEVGIPLMLGYCYSELQDNKQAKKFYKRAIKLAPRHELASLGLFHAHINELENTEALREVRRFFEAGGKSQDYDDIIKEWKNNI